MVGGVVQNTAILRRVRPLQAGSAVEPVSGRERVRGKEPVLDSRWNYRRNMKGAAEGRTC